MTVRVGTLHREGGPNEVPPVPKKTHHEPWRLSTAAFFPGSTRSRKPSPSMSTRVGMPKAGRVALSTSLSAADGGSGLGAQSLAPGYGAVTTMGLVENISDESPPSQANGSPALL